MEDVPGQTYSPLLETTPTGRFTPTRLQFDTGTPEYNTPVEMDINGDKTLGIETTEGDRPPPPEKTLAPPPSSGRPRRATKVPKRFDGFIME